MIRLPFYHRAVFLALLISCSISLESHLLLKLLKNSLLPTENRNNLVISPAKRYMNFAPIVEHKNIAKNIFMNQSSQLTRPFWLSTLPKAEKMSLNDFIRDGYPQSSTRSPNDSREEENEVHAIEIAKDNISINYLKTDISEGELEERELEESEFDEEQSVYPNFEFGSEILESPHEQILI